MTDDGLFPSWKQKILKEVERDDFNSLHLQWNLASIGIFACADQIISFSYNQMYDLMCGYIFYVGNWGLNPMDYHIDVTLSEHLCLLHKLLGLAQQLFGEVLRSALCLV